MSAPSMLVIKFLSGPMEGEELKCQGERLGVGRTKKSQVYIKDASVSEKHAEFEWAKVEWLLRDVGSSNGTAVNGVMLSENNVVALKNGDRVTFGTDTQTVVEMRQTLTPDITVEEYYRSEAARLTSLIRYGPMKTSYDSFPLPLPPKKNIRSSLGIFSGVLSAELKEKQPSESSSKQNSTCRDNLSTGCKLEHGCDVLCARSPGRIVTPSRNMLKKVTWQ